MQTLRTDDGTDARLVLERRSAGPRMRALSEAVRRSALELGSWPLRRWLVALAGAVVVALVTGIPTDMVPTPLFRRMTPVVWWDWPLWLIASLLFGLVAATYVHAEHRPRRARGGALLGGGLLTVLAVGCPVCNKLVVVALGTAGALTYFAPVQPLLGLASVVLGAAALLARTGSTACDLPELSTPPGISRIES